MLPFPYQIKEDFHRLFFAIPKPSIVFNEETLSAMICDEVAKTHRSGWGAMGEAAVGIAFCLGKGKEEYSRKRMGRLLTGHASFGCLEWKTFVLERRFIVCHLSFHRSAITPDLSSTDTAPGRGKSMFECNLFSTPMYFRSPFSTKTPIVSPSLCLSLLLSLSLSLSLGVLPPHHPLADTVFFHKIRPQLHFRIFTNIAPGATAGHFRLVLSICFAVLYLVH